MKIEFRDSPSTLRSPMIHVTFDDGREVEAEVKGVYGAPVEIFLDRVRQEFGGSLSGTVTPDPAEEAEIDEAAPDAEEVIA